MRILALEPFYDGSHRAFLDGWIRHSRHQWTVAGLPGHSWKWRMRHSAATFARQLASSPPEGAAFDATFASDMLNLAEFRGLAPREISRLPAVVYFHENQLTYPVRVERERDFHFAYTNFTSCLAADEVWFNSQFHLTDFTAALRDLLRRMP
ncbi:MAG: DUF3524 domain-containing protein, partial [Planctomycetales bacterium]|nr:DUF3524 domain-containing protein [Planctomycetales bacterium]